MASCGIGAEEACRRWAGDGHLLLPASEEKEVQLDENGVPIDEEDLPEEEEEEDDEGYVQGHFRVV